MILEPKKENLNISAIRDSKIKVNNPIKFFVFINDIIINTNNIDTINVI